MLSQYVITKIETLALLLMGFSSFRLRCKEFEHTKKIKNSGEAGIPLEEYYAQLQTPLTTTEAISEILL